MLGLLVSASASAAPLDAGAERTACESLADWSPVHLPPAAAELAIPCSEGDLKAFSDAHPLPASAQGVVGCESKARVYHVIYTVNTPDGFFDGFVAELAPTANGAFDVAGHRAFRSAERDDSGYHATQIIEIDPKRALIMSVTSKTQDDTGLAAVSSCFFNTIEFAKS